MTSSPVKPEHCEEFPGVATNSSIGTPRRAQRADTSDTWFDSPQRNLRELDELGRDPDVFETLTDALERHRSRGPSGSKGKPRERIVFPSKPSPAAVPLRVITTTPVTHHNSSSNAHLSLSRHPPIQMDGVQLCSIERSSQLLVSDAQSAASFSVQSSPTDDMFNFPVSSIAMQHTHNVPAGVWTDPLLRGELPLHSATHVGDRTETRNNSGGRSIWRQGGGDSSAGSTDNYPERLAAQQAAEVMETHTGRSWPWFHRFPHIQTASKGADEKGKATNHTHYHHHIQPDIENEFTGGEPHLPGQMRRGALGGWLEAAMNTPYDQRSKYPKQRPGQYHGPRPGNGVLSALLALYDYNPEHDDELSEYGERVGFHLEYQDGSTPKSSLPQLSNLGDNSDCFLPIRQVDIRDESLGSSSFTLSRKPTPSILGHIRSSCIPATSTTAALLVGASALSGVAAPQHATLVPNLKKPGYNLARYSVEELPKVASRTPGIISRGLRRAYSTDSGFTTTNFRTGTEEKGEMESLDIPVASAGVPPMTRLESFVPRSKRGQTHPLPAPREPKRRTGRMKDPPPPLELPTTFYRALPSPHSISAVRERALDTLRWSGTTTPPTASTEYTLTDDLSEKKYHFNSKRIDREAQRIEERERKERQKQREKEIRHKRRKAEVYITRHVAEILQRQEFIMKLARAMIMFGGPSHRLTSQIQSTAHVLDLELSCIYLPDVMLLSFEDSATGTSSVKLIRQGTALDLEKLGEAHALYWKVIHDHLSVSEASTSLDVLMRSKPLYNFIQMTMLGALCSASICSVSFSGSFIDCLVSAPLGGLLVAIQLTAVRNELYAHVFEITVATLMSFLSAALASNTLFCYSAVVSSSVVLILPGYIALSGSLELSSRSLVAGAVRICFAVMYSLFLGFGLAVGADLYHRIVGGSITDLTDYACTISHNPAGPWWQQTPSLWWAFLTVPMYSLFLSMRLMAPWWKKELFLCIGIASMGWATNHFVGTKFPNQSDISAACGAFVVGFVSNIYGRFFNGNSFVVMITGILFQVPSGLGRGGLLNFALEQTQGSRFTFVSGFHTALQLISVALGLTVGLGISLVVVHPIQSRRRAGGLFSL